MSIITTFILIIIKIADEVVFSLYHTNKCVRNHSVLSITNISITNFLIPNSSSPKTLYYDRLYNNCFIKADPNQYFKSKIHKTELFSHQNYVLVHSDNTNNSFNHYNGFLSSNSAHTTSEISIRKKKGSHIKSRRVQEPESAPNNEDFFDYFLKKFNEPENPDELNWKHPMPCAISQMAALQCVKELMPPSSIHKCFEITDDTKLDDIISTKLGPYYSTLSYDMFFKYQKGFYFDMDAGEVVKSEIKPLKIQKPVNAPELECDKVVPTVPMGWRTFVILGLFDTPDSKEFWCSTPLTDGDPPPRVSSGLFKYGEYFNFMASRDAVTPEGLLLYTKDQVPPGEHFTGEKGDMSIIPSGPPEEHKKISKNTYKYMISEDGIWPRKHFENVVESLSSLQALWARLSTTIIKSTSKVIQIFTISNKLNVQEYYKNLKKSPVEYNVGVLYFMAAPTLHHAMAFACSDPVARSNFYKNLLIFEPEDVLRDMLTAKKETDMNNPREYIILGHYSKDQPFHMLNDLMGRFLVRSNCVRSYYNLKSPRKDNIHDLNMPLEQLLPFKEYTSELLKDKRIRNACLNKNYSTPLGDLCIINKFDFDDALEWARRNPYTRAGCYDSLFVTMADEVVFYGENTKFALPVPIPKKLIPSGQEYLPTNRDPLKILCERMKQYSGHVLTVPNQINKFIPRVKEPVQNVKDNLKKRGDRLLITVKKSVLNHFTSENISKLVSSSVKENTEYKLHKTSKYSVVFPSTETITESNKLCDVQTFPYTPFTLELLIKSLEENAPRELDKPFYARFLQDYVYFSLPEGHFFEPNYKYDNKRFNTGRRGEFETNVGAEQMLLLDEYKIEPMTGFWARKGDYYIFNNNDHLVIAPNRSNTYKEMDPRLLKSILIQDEVFADIVRKGGTKERVDVSNSYSKYDGRLICHLTDEERMKTAYTVSPMNKIYYDFGKKDQLPYCRYFERPIAYGDNHPKTLMRYYPYELYQIQLEFMEKLDKGHVSISEDPLKKLAKGSFNAPIKEHSVSTWEEPDVNLLKEHPPSEAPRDAYDLYRRFRRHRHLKV
uniref:Uncharacterized protein n=1 Tax=Theileria annulata TaxID=5874 RepID=A0A3B0N655_THEAN